MKPTSRTAAPALLLLGPAAIHLAVAPMHFQEYVPFGLFFVATALLQAAAAAATILRPTRRLFAAAAAGTAAIIAAYVVSRTTGVPVGPRPWQPEMIGFPDIACTAMELISLPLLVTRA